MIDLSVVELARGLREPLYSVRQQVEERGSVGGIEARPVRDETGRIEKVRVSEQVASRLDLTVPKAETRPNPEPEPTPEPEPVEAVEAESPATVATESVKSLQTVPTVERVPVESHDSRPNPERKGNPLGWIAFGALAATALMSEPIRREMIRYFREHPRP
jgi:hypothetical protein